VETTRGFIGAGKVGVAVAGSFARHGAGRAMRLPIESHVLQAFVSEGLKPVIDGVITFGAGHFYSASPTRAGWSLAAISTATTPTRSAAICLWSKMWPKGHGADPRIGRARLLRMWGGVMDMSMDGSPIIDRTPIEGPLFQWRLVLWRVQGNASFGLVLCASAKHRYPPPHRHRLSAGSVPQGPDDRRKRHGRAAQPALGPKGAIITQRRA
jgi:hypothetical protein